MRTDASIKDEYSHVWFHRIADLHHLFEQLAFLLVPTGSIDNDDLKLLFLELCDTLAGNGDGIRLRVRAEVGDLGFSCRLSSLIEGTSTEGISANYT